MNIGTEQIITTIEDTFRKQVRKDPKIRNAYLLIDSEKQRMHLNIAEGNTNGYSASPDQPNYMASVGKLFTSTITGILHDLGELSFDDPIAQYLDSELTHHLNYYKGTDYSSDITIRHLLNQTSGLPDYFWQLLNRIVEKPGNSFTPREAILWAKDHLKTLNPPGRKMNYTDTNYHLLGLIIEYITGKPFHEVLHELIFNPVDMKHSWMLHVTDPLDRPETPLAEFYWNKIRMNDFKTYAGLDYAGGGVVAPMADLLKFMKALMAHKLVSAETLDKMKNDRVPFNPGIKYGYGIWNYTTIPILLPEKLNCWGVAGATGAFMFYHPLTETCVIGNFNHTAYMRKGIRFMLLKVIKQLC